jgi:hypothetical protein
MFYRQAAKSNGENSSHGQIFTAYSVELAKALSQMPAAPGYTRAIGAWMAARDLK